MQTHVFILKTNFRISLSFFFPEFIPFTDFRIDQNKRTLFYNGYRFHRNGTNKNRVYYLCAGYWQHDRCKARVTTHLINGVEMLKIGYDIHTHAPDLLHWTQQWPNVGENNPSNQSSQDCDEFKLKVAEFRN